MLQINNDFRNKVAEALLNSRKNFEGTDSQFAKRWGMSAAIFSRIKSGDRDGLIKDSHWLSIGRELNVSMKSRTWKAAETDVFKQIKEDILFCKAHSKARMFVDRCEIGKTFTAKYLSRTIESCFYLDASQSKSKTAFIRALAKTIGVDHTEKIAEVKANIKYYLNQITKPIMIIDEAGDLNNDAFLELKEFWNATENTCGWYLIGADGLRSKIDKGMKNKKVGYRELFSRFSMKYDSIVPTAIQDKTAFYNKLITDVLSVNMANTANIPLIVKKCLIVDDFDNMGGLRRAESLLILNGEV